MPRGEKLVRNLIEVLWEQELKLGYLAGPVRLYYPPASLEALLEGTYPAGKLKEALAEAFSSRGEIFEGARVEESQGRLCLILPARAVAYVHEHHERGGFLEELVRLVEGHEADLGRIRELFGRYGSFREEEGALDSHGILLSFEDGEMDSFVYLFSEEAGHVSYHRYTREDYEALKRELEMTGGEGKG